MLKILILGGSGLIGKSIISEINKCKRFESYSTYFKNSIPLDVVRSLKLNVEDSHSIDGILNILKPEIIISCLRGNYDKQLIVHTKCAEYLKKNDGKLYFCSTTNVFDNDSSKPHYEDDLPNSCTDYGKYKIECEKRIVGILHNNACIIRLPQIWGKDSPRMKQLLKSLISEERVLVYPKLLINTNLDILIAKKISYIIEHKLTGKFHLVAEDVISHKEFYNELTLGLGFNNLRFEESIEEEGYFALLSKRANEFPKELGLTNKEVINYLISNCPYSTQPK
jgi:dTDP-4-dehydrorhamnose reductase